MSRDDRGDRVCPVCQKMIERDAAVQRYAHLALAHLHAAVERLATRRRRNFPKTSSHRCWVRPVYRKCAMRL